MTILIADDNLASRERMRELLEASGHRVVEATNGRETLDLIHRDPPSLVFLHLQTPVLDGFCVVRNCEANRFPRLADLGHRVVGIDASEALAHANRVALPRDCNELPGERWFFRIGAVRASPLNRSQSGCHGP